MTQRLWRSIAAGGALALAAPAFAEPPPTPIVERATGTRFPAVRTVDGTSYRCLGAAARKVLFFKAYAVTYCLEARRANEVTTSYAASAHPGLSGAALRDALGRDSAFFQVLADAPGNKLVVMQMVRDVSRGQLAKAFHESLEKILPPASVNKLIAAIPADAEKGQAVIIHSQGNELVIDIGGKASTIDDPLVAKKLWEVWLGPQSVTPDLRKSIAEQVAFRSP